MPRPINPRLRDDLLDAAILLLERQGPSFSVRDLSAEIDYSATAVYRCFASRGDLLKAVQVRLFVELVTELMPPSPCDEAVSAQILDLGRRFVVWGVDHPVRYTFMFQNADPDALLDEHERNIARAPLLALEALVILGMDQGVLASGSAKTVALMFFASVHGLISLHHAQRLEGFMPESPQEVYEAWATLWIAQISVES